MLGTSILLGATVRKAVLALVVPLLILFAASRFLLPGAETTCIVLAFWAGLLFPDLDVITGFIRTTFQTMLLMVLMAGAVLLYPALWGTAAGYCPTDAIRGAVDGAVSPLFVCQIGLAALLMAAAWILSFILVFCLPAKNSFHSWTSMVVISAGVGMLNQILSVSTSPWLLTAGFALGYASHILADTVFDFLPVQKKKTTT